MTLDADTARVTISFSGVAVPLGAQVVFAVDNPGMAVAPTAGAALVFTNFIGLVEQMSTQVSMTHVLFKQGPDETGPSGEFSGAHAGLEGGSAVPPNTSILLSKITNQGGRSGRGRMYLPGFREDRVDGDGTVNSVNVGNINAAALAFLNDMAADDLQVVLEHGPGSPFGVPGVVLSMVCSSKVATQRRRLRH